MRHRPLCFVCLALFLFLWGAVLMGGEKWFQELRPSPLDVCAEAGEQIRFTGRVYQREERDAYQILYLKENSVQSEEQSFQISGIMVYDEKKKDLAIGSRLVVEGEAFPQRSARNPGGFDQRIYDRRRGIYGSVWATDIQTAGGGEDWFMEGLCQFRQAWRRQLVKAMGEKDGETLSAILLGEKAGMDPEMKELYQDQGIGHILAISGLHLSLIGLGAYRVLRRGTGSYLAGGAAGIGFLGLYVVMIGLSVSVVRAFLMFLFRIGADMTGRHYDGLTALSFSAAAVLLWRPLSVYDGGFWLSFGAVLGLLLLLPLFRGLPCQGFWSSFCVNLVIFPILAWYFFEFPPWSLILNLVVIPLFSVLLVSGLVGSLLLWASIPLGELLLGVCKGIFWLYEGCCRIAALLPGARVITGQPEVWQMVFYYLCLAGIFVLLWNWKRKRLNDRFRSGPGHRHRAIPWIGSAVLLIAGIGILLFPAEARGELSVTVLDVGQGDGIFIRDPAGGTCLIDGGSSSEDQIGRYTLEPFLKSRGVDRLDYVLVSHGDVDHYSGILELIQRRDQGIDIGTLVLPQRSLWEEQLENLALQAQRAGIPVAVMAPGDVLGRGGMTLTCLQPGEDFHGEPGNEASLVLALQYGEFDMLFTGDVEGKGEDLLTRILEEDYQDVTWDVLKAAHHGSKNSTGEAFLEAAAPSRTLISAGKDNRYGHPHKETLERLREAGSRMYSTADHGAIEVRTDGKSMGITGFCG